ncbi:VOC family protein [Methylocapsa acidiphila]|uniref:VOC family protein n=1 Tax=Methylocapsa acidiphila TaxID=133552 RepID=UPI00041A7D57|nr:VOC family protein [Methylocapsa acidiphila]
MKLNHVNLPSIDVPADRAMFERYFGLRCLIARGAGMVVMEDDDGVVLVLSNLPRKRGSFAYPEDSDVLHIGFIQETREAVDAMHIRLVADGWDAPAPRDYHGAWTFYFKAKGGYFIEVTTPTPVDREGERRRAA